MISDNPVSSNYQVGGVMVSVLASSVVEHGFEPALGKRL